jgi:hypothetical protein
MILTIRAVYLYHSYISSLPYRIRTLSPPQPVIYPIHPPSRSRHSIPPPPIHNIKHLLPLLPPRPVLNEQPIRPLPILPPQCTNMWRDNRILRRPQRIPLRQRLRIRNIQCRTEENLIIQSLDKGRLIDQPASRDVNDEAGTGFLVRGGGRGVSLSQYGELGGAEEVFCRGR